MALCHGGRNLNSRPCELAACLPGQGALTQLTTGGAYTGLGRCPVLDQGIASFSSEGGDKGWAFTVWERASLVPMSKSAQFENWIRPRSREDKTLIL